MKRQTVILPFSLPRLSDTTAAQLVDLLHELIAGIEHHYAAQIHRYNKRQAQISCARPSHTSSPTHPPF